MPELRPFRGIRYTSASELKRLVCPPYDVISAVEQARLHERHPNNAVHLELARGDASPDKYKVVARTFERWVREGVLSQDEEARLYVYRQDYVSDGKRRRVTGVIGELLLEPYGRKSGILPHERTMPAPIEDRLSLMRACPVNVSPIYAIYRGGGGLGAFFEALGSRPTQARFTDDHGTLHRVWMIEAPAEVRLLADTAAKGPLVIADGHHRYETALAYRAEQRGPGGYDAIMCFCVDAESEDVTILPYHRALRARVAAEELSDRFLERFATKELALGEASAALSNSDADHPYALVTPRQELLVDVSDADVTEALGEAPLAWRALDVVALHEVVLPAVLPEGAPRLHYSIDDREIIRLVKEQGWTAGILLRPLDPVQVVEVARSGRLLPQKASYFWPKAVTGLVFRTLR
jgi:uncharacterized protein (DUF1015 family)